MGPTASIVFPGGITMSDTHSPARRRRRRAGGTLLLAGVLTVMSLGVTGPAAASDTPAPGAPGLGDPMFPSLGNGGYDVAHYDLDFSYTPATRTFRARTGILATATQALSRFDGGWGPCAGRLCPGPAVCRPRRPKPPDRGEEADAQEPFAGRPVAGRRSARAGMGEQAACRDRACVCPPSIGHGTETQS